MTLWLTGKFPPGFVLITECGLKIRWVSARVQACVNNPVCSLYCVARARRVGRTIPFAFCLCAIILPGQSCPLCVLSPKATNCICGWRDREGFLFWKWIAITCKPTLKRHDSCLTASSSSGAPSSTSTLTCVDAGLYVIHYKVIHILVCIVHLTISSETRKESQDSNREGIIAVNTGSTILCWAVGGGIGELQRAG